MSIACRTLLASLLLLVPIATAAEPKPLNPSQAKADPKDSTLWYDIQLLPIEGQGWQENKSD